MATITTLTKSGSTLLYESYLSDPADPAADTVEMFGLSGALTHCFIGVQMFDGGGALIVASAGSYAVAVRTLNTRQFETPPSSSIDATAPATLSVAGNIEAVRVTPTGVTGVVTMRVFVTCNRR